MGSIGTSRRLRRLHDPQGRFFLFALDHGLPAGPLPGIEDASAAVRRLEDAPLTGVIVNRVAESPEAETVRAFVEGLAAGLHR